MPNQDTPVLILGCGYTGQRVASRLLGQGTAVTATTRDPNQPALRKLAQAGATILRFDTTDQATFEDLKAAIKPETAILHSLPGMEPPALDSQPESPAEAGEPSLVLDLLKDASRIVHLSTTGVYGNQREVDEQTAPAPSTERQQQRLAAEQAIREGPWPSLILRAAAIYGPGRGVHVRLKQGRFRLLGDGSNYVSRIHVEDLAALAVAGLFSQATGAYPVADLEPCRSAEICAFCAQLLGVPLPPPATAEELDETRRSDRRVDGRAIFDLLGIKPQFPSYRQGIPAALEQEGG